MRKTQIERNTIKYLTTILRKYLSHERPGKINERPHMGENKEI